MIGEKTIRDDMISVGYNIKKSSQSKKLLTLSQRKNDTHSWEANRERAMKEICVYPNYDQTAFITQKAIDQLLTFDGYQEV